MKKKILIPAFFIVAAIVAGIFYFNRQQTEESTSIRVSGNIEVTAVEVSFRISGRMVERLVSEGETVKAGQPVARLDSRDLREEIGLRKAQVAAARAVLKELEQGSRPEEIGQAHAVLERAQAEGARAKDEFARQNKLYEREVISAREYDAAKTALESADARIQEAKEMLTLIRKGPRREKIEQARAGLDQANQTLAMAETRLTYCGLYSPLSGIVLSDNVEPGEYVSPGTPVVTLGNLKALYLRAYINETDLGKVKLGQQVRVTNDTYPGKVYEGKIAFISSQAEFTPKNVQTPKERVKLVYRIKVDISNPQMELKPGMPADGEILLK
jgi:membrane fusion protein YbhG